MKDLLTEGKLKGQPFVNDASPEFLNRLSEFSTEVSFEKGQVIFREGGYADQFFLILSGRVDLEMSGRGKPGHFIQTLGPGEVLGWSWLYPPFIWHFTARAVEPCMALAFKGASLLIRAEEDPKFGYELMKRISQQVIHRLHSVREQILENKHEPK